MKTEPLPFQKKFHRHVTPSGKTATHILLSTGVKAGKAHAFAEEINLLLHHFPGIKIAVITAHPGYFDEFISTTFCKVFDIHDDDNPDMLRRNKAEGKYLLRNGSSLLFRAYDSPGNVKGWEADCVFFICANLFGGRNDQKARAIYDAALQRMRPKNDMPNRVYVAQTPEGHNWVWRLFIEPNECGDVGIITSPDNGGPYREYEHATPDGNVYYAISAPSTANPHLPETYVDSLINAREDDPGMVKRVVAGQFNEIPRREGL